MTKIDSRYHDVDYSRLFFSHESWSKDGEYLYITCLGGDGTEYSNPGGVIRVNKDGTHRKFYYPDTTLNYETPNHSTPSGDNRYAVMDNRSVSVLSLETNQLFPICNLTAKKPGETGAMVNAVSLGHPYHAHAVVAHDKYIANWGMVLEDNGELGIGWYDFSGINESGLADGGKVQFGTDVKYIAYHEPRAGYPAMPCDIDKTESGLCADAGEKVYLDIDEDIIDDENGSVTITFDYYDDSTNSLKLTYSKGVETDDDRCQQDNMSKTITRSGTNTWKTATVTIESGNFENFGRYDSDFNISGVNSGCHVANVRVKNASSIIDTADIQLKSITDNGTGYKIKGEVKKNNNSKDAATILATSRKVEPVVENLLYADFNTDGTITTSTKFYNSDGDEMIKVNMNTGNATTAGGELTIGNSGRLLLEPKTPFNTGTYRVSFSFMTPDEGTGKANLPIYGNTVTGKITTHSPATYGGSEHVWVNNASAFAITSGEWYDFECIFDLDAGTYTMTIDDTTVKTGTFAANTSVARIFDHTQAIPATRTIKYDNLIIDKLTNEVDVRFANTTQKVSFGTDTTAKFELDLEALDGSEINFFVFNDLNKLNPIGAKLKVRDMSLSAQSMANGVRLTWNAVEGATSYTVFKDGKKIATTTQTTYDDKYFATVEQFTNDIMEEYTTPHTYMVEAGGYVSTSVEACADTSLIHYIKFNGLYETSTEKTSDVVASFGDTSNDEYTVILTAQRATVSGQSVFAVTDANGSWATLPLVDASKRFGVYYGHTGHPLTANPAINFTPVGAKKFPTTTYTTSNTNNYTKLNTYVFDINACFNNTLVDGANFKLLRNSDGEYPIIQMVGFVKSEYYIK